MITVKLTFFKTSGKYYSSGEYETTLTAFHEIIDHVRFKRNIKQLPGLAGGWEGPILVQIGGPSVPHLILPEDM